MQNKKLEEVVKALEKLDNLVDDYNASLLVKNQVVSNMLLTKAHPSDAGYDIKCVKGFSIPPHSFKAKIPTGLYLAIPKGMYGQIVERSSHAARGIKVAGGVIDSGYRGEILVNLVNCSDKEIHFRAGDRIAQIIFLFTSSVVVLGDPTKVESDRGANGFGSSGK